MNVKKIVMILLVASLIILLTHMQVLHEENKLLWELSKVQNEVILEQDCIIAKEEVIIEKLEELKGVTVSEVTYYCDCEICTGKWVTTSTGTIPDSNRTVAVDPDIIPLGSEVYIEGIGWRLAEDTGGAINSTDVDVFMDSHEAALQAGRDYLNILWR